LAESYWVCRVHGVLPGPGRIYLPDTYAVNLASPRLASPDPARLHIGEQVVASDEQIAELHRRGFKVSEESGPHVSVTVAQDALDDAWEWPGKQGAAEEAEERLRAVEQQREQQAVQRERRGSRAAQGDPHAQLSLAIDDERNGDWDQAAARYRAAARAGLAGAQYRLGLLYSEGKGVSRDLAESARWWRKAAEQDHRDAQYSLARLYAEGLGVTRDDVEAYLWLHVSIGGPAGAPVEWKAMHDAVAARLTAEQKEEARRRFRARVGKRR
jgi:tetratricopeptide (TPR) repeat protein